MSTTLAHTPPLTQPLTYARTCPHPLAYTHPLAHTHPLPRPLTRTLTGPQPITRSPATP